MFFELLVSILVGYLLGTFGLAYSHIIVHKFKLYNISICWKLHMDHHRGLDLGDWNGHLISYMGHRISRYLDIRRLSILDLASIAISIAVWQIGIALLVALVVSESIGYFQHDSSGRAIDNTNRLENLIGLNVGRHSAHHNMPLGGTVNTFTLLALPCVYLWVIIVYSLKPLLFIVKKEPTVAGAYLFGFTQNVANYRAIHGQNLDNVLWRCSSIYDKPSLLVEYLLAMFNSDLKGKEFRLEYGESIASDISFSHGVSSARNVYLSGNKKIEGGPPVIIFDKKVIEGHHRVSAGYRGEHYLIVAS